MKKLAHYLYIGILLVGFNNPLLAQLKPKDVLSRSLEKDIWWIIESSPTKKDVISKFGTPQLVEKDKIYYVRHDYKYALSFSFHGDKLSSFSYKLPPETKLSALDFKEAIPASEYKSYPESGHDAGKFMKVSMSDLKLQLLFRNSSDKQLDKIIYEK